MATVEEIKDKRHELELLEEEYLRDTPPCQNTNCAFYRSGHAGNCLWSVMLEDCGEYKAKHGDL